MGFKPRKRKTHIRRKGNCISDNSNLPNWVSFCGNVLKQDVRLLAEPPEEATCALCLRAYQWRKNWKQAETDREEKRQREKRWLRKRGRSLRGYEDVEDI